MDIRIKEKLKNQQGSSLAFVLIIGMVIMIMVASLLAVANSDFTFTQETVESRQAYIDAKSVIEFGKIEINERMAELEIKDQQLKKLYLELEALETNSPAIVTKKAAIQTKIAEINTFVSNDLIAPYYIGGDENNISKTLQAIGDQVTAVGILKVVSENSGNEIKKYTFKIETQNLRRKLDFEAPFNYGVVTTTTPGTEFPVLPNDNGDWIGAFIQNHDNGNGKGLIMKFTGSTKQIPESKDVLDVNLPLQSLDIGKKNGNGQFEWTQSKTLDLNVENVRFTVPIPSTGTKYSTFKIKAKTVIFEGDLNIFDQTVIDIDCDTLWVKGNVNINESTGPYDSKYINHIKAKNIIIGNPETGQGGDITIGNVTSVIWECEESFWALGDVDINTNAPASENRISAKNIFVGGPGVNQTGNISIKISSNVVWESAKDIWVKGNINIEDRSTVNWKCQENLWLLKGITIKRSAEGDQSSSAIDAAANKISAKNIIVGTTGNQATVTVENYTKVIWDCQKCWVYGNINAKSATSQHEFINLDYLLVTGNIVLENLCELTFRGSTQNSTSNKFNQITVLGEIETKNSNASLKFLNVNYINTGDIKLGMSTKLEVTGESGKTNNQMVAGHIIPSATGNNAHEIAISNLYGFACGQLNLNDASKTSINSTLINIKGDLTLGWVSSFEILAKVFDCTGKTTIKYLRNPINIKPQENALDVRFEGGYDQEGSTVNITNANNLIFGGLNGPIKLANPQINVKADYIYFDSDNVVIPGYTNFSFTGRSQEAVKEFNIKTLVLSKEGKYADVHGSKLEDLMKTPSAYAAPEFSAIVLNVPPAGLLPPTAPDISAGGSGTGTGGGGTGGGTTIISIEKLPTRYY